MGYKVLVTGGAGFVGRHVIQRLLELGHQVHCVDKLAPLTGGLAPKSWPLFAPNDFDNFYFYQEDCREYFRRVADTDFDYCFHLAAMVGGRLMIENNPLAVADDLAIDSEYWQWAVKAKPKKTLCFSSSAAYPIKYQQVKDYQLLKEDMISFASDLGMPDMSYGWAKLTCEYLAHLAYAKHGLKSIVYRPFSGYGEDQDLTYPFPSICQRVLANQRAKAITVWGSGRQMRDFIHIDDCVEGVFRTMDKIDNGEAVNLATGLFTSFIDFTKIAAKLLNFEPEVKGTTDKPEGVFARAGDPTKLAKLGFTHTILLKEGIKRGLDYYAKKYRTS